MYGSGLGVPGDRHPYLNNGMKRGDLTNAEWERRQLPFPAQKAQGGTAGHRSSLHPQRHSVDPLHRSSLEGSARALWPLEHNGPPLRPTAEGNDRHHPTVAHRHIV
jgi:hypothetical protein